MRRTIFLTAALAAAGASCDGDGCYGGPNGPATKFCQQSLTSVDSAHVADACKTCCIQEVPYTGKIEDGKCVCR
jgi:hypothetical protein